MLKLVLQETVKCVQSCCRTFDLSQKIYVVIEGSPNGMQNILPVSLTFILTMVHKKCSPSLLLDGLPDAQICVFYAGAYLHKIINYLAIMSYYEHL